LSLALAVQATALLAGPVSAKQPADASASQSASPASASVRDQEEAQVQRWDGLDRRVVQRKSERESRPRFPQSQAEPK